MLDQKRIEWIDLLRSLAITLVLLCHCSQTVYVLNVEFMSSIKLTSRLFALTAFTAGRLGVPFFLLISGYLLLDREYDTDTTLRFWKNNWLHLLICTYVWIIIYNIFEVYLSEGTFSINHLLNDVLLLQSKSMSHMWYMPMLLGMYPLFPYVANALRSINFKLVLFPLILFSLYAFGFPCLNVWGAVLGKGTLPIEVSLGFSGGAYGLYFVVGYLLKKGLLKKIKSWMLFYLSIGTFILTVFFQFWAYQNNYAYNVWYDNPFLAISSVTIFELFSRIKHVPLNRAFKSISYYSFALYLIHNIILRSIPQECITPPQYVLL